MSTILPKDALDKLMVAWKTKIKPVPEFQDSYLSVTKPKEEKKK